MLGNIYFFAIWFNAMFVITLVYNLQFASCYVCNWFWWVVFFSQCGSVFYIMDSEPNASSAQGCDNTGPARRIVRSSPRLRAANMEKMKFNNMRKVLRISTPAAPNTYSQDNDEDDSDYAPPPWSGLIMQQRVGIGRGATIKLVVMHQTLLQLHLAALLDLVRKRRQRRGLSPSAALLWNSKNLLQLSIRVWKLKSVRRILGDSSFSSQVHVIGNCSAGLYGSSTQKQWN